MSENNLEKPCSGANYAQATNPAGTPANAGCAGLKKNCCDRYGKCTAEDHDDLISCKYFTAEEIDRPTMCGNLSKLGDKCSSPEATEEAKYLPQSIVDPRD